VTADHEHRHIHLDSGMFWWHRHDHECDESDFNGLHHHPPAGHNGFPASALAPWLVDGHYPDALDEPGWRT
jgi:hypothetical protein